MMLDTSCQRNRTMYRFGYDQRNEATGRREIEAVVSPVPMMTYSGKDRHTAIDPRSGLPLRDNCMYQVPVTVNSDSSGDNIGYSRAWDKPTNADAEITGRHNLGMSYREKWEQLRNSNLHKEDCTVPTTDHHSSTLLDIGSEDCRKDTHRIYVKDRSNMFGSYSESAVDDPPKMKTPESHPGVSPSHLNLKSPHSRTVGPLETPKTPSTATPVKVSTPIHDKSIANSSQPMWYGDALSTPATDQDSSDHCKRLPFHKQNGNPGREWSNTEVFSGNLRELDTCQRRSHDTTRCGMRYARDNGRVSNVLLGVLCLLMSSFGLVLLLHLTYRTSEELQAQSGDSLLSGGNSSYTILKDIAVGLSALVVLLNVWCLLTMALISYLAARLLKCQNGDQRASEFIHQCEVTRVVAAAGAFASIPVFMLALLLYTIVHYSFVSAVICVVIFSSGTTCTTITIVHSMRTWHQQKSMTILQQDPVLSSSDVQNVHDSVQNPAVNYFELSTLV